MKNLYRSDLDLERSCVAELTPLAILYRRFKERGIIAGFALAMPGNEIYNGLADQAASMGIAVSRFSEDQIIEKPAHLRQQRWNLEDDTGDETWIGAVFANVIEEQSWDTVVLMPLVNLLIEPQSVFLSLELHRREAFDVCFVEERIAGAGWTIFQADLLKGLLCSHEELMWARGGLSWALRKPLYPFKIGYYHCPRIRPALRVDLRLNSKRAQSVYSLADNCRFDSEGFSYADWLNDSGWEKHYADFSPLIVNVEPTNRCDGKCFNCGHSRMQRPEDNLDLKIFAETVAQFASHREVHWAYSGMGEPFLHNDLAGLIRTTRDFSASLVTSLQVLPPDDFPFADLATLRISIDALEADSFARFRPGCSWQNVETFLSRARDKKKAAPEKFPELGVTFLRHELNENQQQSFLNYWKQVAKPVYRENFFRWPFNLSPEAVQWYQILGESNSASVNGRSAKVDFTPIKRRPCRHALLSTTVLADCSVTICPHDFEGKFKLGNLKENSLTSIWLSSAYQNFRSQHLEMKFSSDLPCGQCQDWYHSI